jgi:hypothetical protein
MIIHGLRTTSILALADRLQDVNVAVRWGGDCVPGALNGECHLLNGLEQLEAFKDAGLTCPEFFTDKWQARHMAADGKILFGRRFNHTQGRDIRISSLPRQTGHRRWYNSDFFTVYVPSIAEWRFHIFQGKSILRANKISPPGQDRQFMIRNRRNGYRYRYDIVPKKELREAAKQAVECVGYDFGAVDLLETENGYCLLEVNSRPGLKDEITLTKYEQAIRNL